MASADVLTLTGTAQLNRWNVGTPLGTSVALTFSFSTAAAAYDPIARPGFKGLSVVQQAQVRQALESWSIASGITFIEVPAAIGGQLRIGLADLTGVVDSAGKPVSVITYLPSYRSVSQNGVTTAAPVFDDLGGDIFLDAGAFGSDQTMVPGQRGYVALVHEIGHALGFKSPTEETPTLDPARDNTAVTVMSENVTSLSGALQALDLEAAQTYYGALDVVTSWDPARATVTRTGSADDEWVLGTGLDDALLGLGGGDTVLGYGGNDTLQGGAGADALDGGEGFDTASYTGSASGVSVNLLAGTGSVGDAAGDALKSIESVIGSALADTLIGSDDHNIIEGGGGTDVIAGNGGNDWVSYEHASGRVAVTLAAGFGFVGEASGDVVTGMENIIGSASGDFLYGDEGANILRGGGGADVLYGDANSDTIDYSDNLVALTVDLSTNAALGGLAQGDTLVSVENVVASAYADVLIGDSASNTLYGWFGVDQMTGNGGNDIFMWRSVSDSGVAAGQRDTVADFWRSHFDLLDFSGIDADGDASNGDQAFTFIGTAAFSAAGQIRYGFDGATTVVELNVGDTLAADSAVQILNGNLALAAVDFRL